MGGLIQLAISWILFFSNLSIAQSNGTLGLQDGYLNFSTSDWDLKLVKDSQVLASLKPAGSIFDFSPFDVLSQRDENGNYHTGDITLRYRTGSNQSWTDANSASERSTVTADEAGLDFASANLQPTLPGLKALNITRSWINLDGDLAMIFTISNVLNETVELGSLGFPIEFNSIFTNREAEAVESNCSLQDPYIGLDAGYVQVTPVDGVGPALVVTPLNVSKFEAWRFLPEDTTTSLLYQSQTFEGFYEFQVLTKAWAENEWKNVTPWNEPTSRLLQPSETMTAGLRFSLAGGGVTDIESTVLRTGLSYAQNVPGLIIPNDMAVTLFLNHTDQVTGMNTDPPDAFIIQSSASNSGIYTIIPKSSTYGHVRLTVNYASNHTQTIHYNVVKSGPTVLSDLGNFLTTTQYYTDTSDPFHRAPSIISYDRSVSNYVTQDFRVWIAGLSDEAGAGSWLAAAMKQAAAPNAEEVTRLEAFVLNTLWGTIQVDSGDDMYGVRKSIFYYGKPGFNYDESIPWQPEGESWNKTQAYSTVRAYDYVHVSAAYWALYRVARAYPELVSGQDWRWYLNQSYQTVIKCTARSSNGSWLVPFANDGLMGETVWGILLTDLTRENMLPEAATLEASMKARAKSWNTEAVPFGSEMAWDSTGEEGIYLWASHFNLTSTANKALNAIQGYMPTVAHWGWNGNARRYWDFLYGGKIQRIERQIHHYGSGLNAQPLLEQYKKTPDAEDAAYLLRVGFAGVSGPLGNVDAEGFASAAFHSWPDTLEWDPYSGDYGPGFLGLVVGSGCFITDGTSLSGDSDAALVYGGNVISSTAQSITVQPRDPVRRRVYVAALKVQVELDAGAIEQVEADFDRRQILVKIVSRVNDDAAEAKQVVVWVEEYGSQGYAVLDVGLHTARGGWQVPLSNGSASVTVGEL